MTAWTDWELHATARALPLDEPVEAGYSALAVERFRRIDRAIGGWYRTHRADIDGIYIFHYRDVVTDPARVQPATAGAPLPAAPLYAEYLRLRFRTRGESPAETLAAFRGLVIEPLSTGPDAAIVGLCVSPGYDARADVGARYGDLAAGVDPTEEVVRVLTANTELRFLLLDHPDFVPNHDITHLYLSTQALTLAQEAEAFRVCIGRVEGWDAKFRDRVLRAGR